jgi:hypothetical protein
MMHDVPMLADFGARLAFGLACLLLATSWREVPTSFFRTHCVVILGLLVLSTLDTLRVTGLGTGGLILIAAALGAYVAAVSWGLGLPRLALPATLLVTLAAATWLCLVSRTESISVWFFNLGSRLASGLIVGSTLSAMLLGHHYLTAPTMSIAPLKQYIWIMGWSLALRITIALLGAALSRTSLSGLELHSLGSDSILWPMMRWGMGFAGPVVATVMAWKTVAIRSTQSATGILYVAFALVLFGELTSLIASRAGGLIG